MFSDSLRAPKISSRPKEGQVKFLPTFFFETRHPVSFGVRVVAQGSPGEASLGVASGGANDVFAQAQVILRTKRPIPSVLTLEGMFDSRNDLEFLGVGQVPDHDPRNVFLPGVPHDAFYLEKRSRVLANLDMTIAKGVNIVPSSSILLSRVQDTKDSDLLGLSHIFAPADMITKARYTRILYSEFALRLFTRQDWVSEDPGVQFEAYAGYGKGIDGDNLHYLGAGGRAAAFVPVVRRTNTLSPKVVLDAMVPLDGQELPFTVLVRQFNFRGFDLRRDKLSVIASLDYRWVIVRYIAAVLFVDAATVAPTFGGLFANVPRFAGGFGFDIFKSHADLARFAVSGSADGVRILLNLGPNPVGGDRQHRN